MNVPDLLKTKLQVPPVRRDLVVRPRLYDLLDESLSRRLALVSAPAGYGKTTLLSGWARQRALPVAWLSLDEADNDPARFLGHLCASFEGIDPSLAGDLLRMVRADRFGGLGASGSIEAFQTELLNRLQSISHPLVLILDDFHLVSAQPIHRLVAFLVDHLPPQMHMVIVSRADPPLPLALLRARGQLVEIRQSDLRFKPDEALAFLNQVMGLGLETGDVTTLVSRTEGWIAGLQLAATSIRSRADVHRFIQEFSGSNRFVLDYLVDEVLRRQPQEVQDFLLETSILDRLTGPLCDAVIGGQGGGQAMLEELERANLFVVPLDDERRWYRYHRLFADLLRKQLGESRMALARPYDSPEGAGAPPTSPALGTTSAPRQQGHGGRVSVAVLHRRASAWHEQNGLLAGAIDHALAAGDFERAAQLIERVAEATLMRSEATTLLKWLDALPEAQLRARPSLCLHYSWVLLLRGSPLGVVEERLAHAEEHLSPLALPLRAWLAYYRGDVAAAIELSQTALEQLPATELFLRGLASLCLASAYHTKGDVAASQRVLQGAALGSDRTGNVMAAVYAAFYRAECCRREGDLRQARSLLEEALDLATDGSGDRLPIAGQVLMGLGEIAREWNELDVATRYLLEGIALAEGWAPVTAIEAYETLARIRQARGDWDGAHEALRAMRQVAIGFKGSDLVVRAVDMAEARMQIAQSGASSRSGPLLEGVRRWAERYGLGGEVDPPTLEKNDDVIVRRIRKYEYPVAARLLMAEGRQAEAVALLEAALPIAEQSNRIGLVIEYQMLMALAARTLGQSERAMRSLERALALAEPAGFFRIFLDEGEPMARLLHEAASRRTCPGYVGRLLAAYRGSGIGGPGDAGPQRHGDTATWHTGFDSRPPSPDPGPPLSKRELEVLRLVAEGLSNEEIARRLVVSLPTIKFHTSNIFGKLGVRNRTEAVAKAQGLGLLPLASSFPPR